MKKKLVMKIPNISCEHCVARIEDALTEITGVAKVKGNVKSDRDNGCFIGFKRGK